MSENCHSKKWEPISLVVPVLKIKCQTRRKNIHVFLKLSPLHSILFDHSSKNKMLKHSLHLVFLGGGCRIPSACWTLNILVMSEEEQTNFHQPNFSRSAIKKNMRQILNHTSYLSWAHERGSCKFFVAGVNFYRFNAKNWQFTVYFAVITQKIGNLLCILP